MNGLQNRLIVIIISTMILAPISFLKYDHHNAQKRQAVYKKAMDAYDFLRSKKMLLLEVERRPELLTQSSVIASQGQSRRMTKADLQNLYQYSITRYNRLVNNFNAIPTNVFFRNEKIPKKLERHIEDRNEL